MFHHLVADWFHKQIQVVNASRGFGIQLLKRLGKPEPKVGDQYMVLLKSGLNFAHPNDSVVVSGRSLLFLTEIATNISTHFGLPDPNVVLENYDWPYVHRYEYHADPEDYFRDLILVPSRIHEEGEVLFERKVLMNLLSERYKDRSKIKFVSTKVIYMKNPWRSMDFIIVKKARSTHHVSYNGPASWGNITRFLDTFFAPSFPGEFDSRVITLNETQKATNFVADHRPVLIHSFSGSMTSVAEEIDFLSTVYEPEKLSFFFNILPGLSNNQSVIYYPQGIYNEIEPVEIKFTHRTDIAKILAEYVINGPDVSTGWIYRRSDSEQIDTDSLQIHLRTSYSRKLSMEQRSSMRSIAVMFNNNMIELCYASYENYVWQMYHPFAAAESFGRQIYLTAKKGAFSMNETLEEFDKAKIVEFIRVVTQKANLDQIVDKSPHTGDLPQGNTNDYQEVRWFNLKLMLQVLCTALPLFITLRYFGIV